MDDLTFGYLDDEHEVLIFEILGDLVGLVIERVSILIFEICYEESLAEDFDDELKLRNGVDRRRR